MLCDVRWVDPADMNVGNVNGMEQLQQLQQSDMMRLDAMVMMVQVGAGARVY